MLGQTRDPDGRLFTCARKAPSAVVKFGAGGWDIVGFRVWGLGFRVWASGKWSRQ